MTATDTHIKEEVKNRYGSIASKAGGAGRCGPGSCGCAPQDAMSQKIGYTAEELASLPEGANLGLGCGNPLALASLNAGDTVLDLGSGAGIDCFLAAKRVGAEGHVIGVDMTGEMLAKARANAESGGYANVEFRKGEIEALPIGDNAIDVIISNCVINLSPDKPQVFREAFRVLRPGGRAYVSDIVIDGEIPEAIRESVFAYTACVGGALRKAEYLQCIRDAGFSQVEVTNETVYPLDSFIEGAEGSDPQLAKELKRLGKEELAEAARSVLSLKLELIK